MIYLHPSGPGKSSDVVEAFVQWAARQRSKKGVADGFCNAFGPVLIAAVSETSGTDINVLLRWKVDAGQTPIAGNMPKKAYKRFLEILLLAPMQAVQTF